jgi:capsular polysaccharide transport system ATP-binding protein
MIILLNATRIQGSTVILAGATAQFKPRDRVGILAAAGSGKSTLARLFSGIEPPDGGTVLRQGRLSWPMGFAGAFHPDLTAATNITLISEMIGQDPGRTLAFCDQFGGFAGLDRPMKTFSPVERATLAFSLSLAVPCDGYIVDEVIGVGDAPLRAKCDAMLERRLANAGLIFLSRNPAQIKKYCHTFHVLIGGRLIPCPDIDVAATALKLSAEREGAEA